LLRNNSIGTPFIELHTVESTNNYAMGLVHEGVAQHGTAVFAHEQTKGKGQRNKEWISQKGNNIALTVIIEPKELTISESFFLSMCIAVSAQQFVSKSLGEEVKIKWPNDIYWRDRKAGGILIENVLQGNIWKYAVAGIGLNINQTEFPELETKAVSFKQVTGQDFSPLDLAQELCGIIDENYKLLLNASETIVHHYKSCLYKLNETVRLKKDSRVFNARVKDVSTMGELIVQHATEERFSVGEVEWIIPS
jgi:BirA family transcriptional regulator, biotin operon repressor / biotin---[acetyl-CoA-carboxylase] ligase